MEQPEHVELSPEDIEAILKEYAEDSEPDNGGQLVHHQNHNAMEAIVQEAKEQNSIFRFSAKKVALTFPRCPLGRAFIADWFANKWAKKDKFAWILVAEEKHHAPVELVEKDNEEPDTHYHVFLHFKGKLETRNCRIFDIPANNGPGGAVYHPNIKSIVGKDGERNWYNYCTKEDHDWITKGIAKQEVVQKYEDGGSERDKFGAMLQTGQITLYEYIQMKPRELWNFKNLEYGLRAWKGMENSKKIVDWKPLTTNKCRHYWISGPSNSGKTTIIRTLIKHRPELWFQMPVNNDWVGYYDQPYLFLDEFAGQISVSDLNRICDGGAKMNIKGSTCTIVDTPTVFIISNLSLHKCYEKAYEKESELKMAIMNRFKEIDTKEFGWWNLLVDIYPVNPVFPIPAEILPPQEDSD